MNTTEVSDSTATPERQEKLEFLNEKSQSNSLILEALRKNVLVLFEQIITFIKEYQR